jgi:hypothetical protein
MHNNTFLKDQMDKHNLTTWQLQDLLHLHEAEIQTMKGCSMCYAVENMSSSVQPKKGAPKFLNLIAETGLPDYIPGPTQKAIFRKIRSMMSGDNPLLEWKEPLQVEAYMKVTLRDTQLLDDDPCSNQTIIFRAAKHFQGVPSQDCIKVLVESDAQDSATYFAQCMSFIKDSNDENFAIVRWFEGQDANGFDPITHVPSFTLESENRTDSYCVLPAYSVLNGAVMVPGKDNKYWALLSPNEEKSYARQFPTNT